ncbi:hypothetical protein QQP08_015127 [Theobroma cacao]|nr:hypothetical protein QQP08_015127 [Theobroma cacao]
MESFSTLPTPYLGQTPCFCRLGVLDGKLSLKLRYRNNDAEPPSSHLHSHELWVMKEYGVRSSWTKLLTERELFSKPLWISKGNALISFSRRGLMRCDCEGTKPEEFKICKCDKMFHLHEAIVANISFSGPSIGLMLENYSRFIGFFVV